MIQTWPGEERRKHWRYPCVGEALVRTPGADISLRAQLSDISLGGCYLDMMNPFPSETEVELTLAVGDTHVRTKGRVRASRQGFGMGIAFTEIVGPDRARLEKLISLLASSFPLERNLDAESLNKTSLNSEPHMSWRDTLNPLEPLLELLRRKGVITHKEHEELTQKSDR